MISSNQTKTAASCPYAVALHSDNDEDDYSSGDEHHPSTISATTTTTITTATTNARALIQSCPAFSQGSCPFAACAPDDDAAIRRQLAHIPASHYQGDIPEFLKVFERIHAVAAHTNATPQQKQQQPAAAATTTTLIKKNEFVLEKKFRLTACPVASKLNHTKSTGGSSSSTVQSNTFTQALDGFSLAAIMAKLAEEILKEEEQSSVPNIFNSNHNENSTTTPTEPETEMHPEDYDESSGKMETESATAAVLVVAEAAITPDAAAATTTIASTVSSSSSSEPTPTTMRRSTSHVRLSESFKQGTAVSHQAAEDVHFVRNFIRGQIDRKLYAELVIQLYHVYDALEGCLADGQEHAAELQQFQKFHSQLRRKETLQEDLDFWHGPVVAAQIIGSSSTTTTTTASLSSRMSPATRDYVERLHHCAATHPLLLLAHSYTRYLGDLSGGKILARVARKAMDLPKTANHEGLAFYEFAAIASAKAFKDEFRTALDALDLTDEEIGKLVGEANVAFLLNMRLFEELDVAANVPGAAVRPLQDALAYAEQKIVVAPASNAKCPFDLGSSSKATTMTKTTSAGSTSNATVIPAECPFSNVATTTTTTPERPKGSKGRCPWPFILAHDPVAALNDWQTWALFGLILCYVWSKLQ